MLKVPGPGLDALPDAGAATDDMRRGEVGAGEGEGDGEEREAMRAEVEARRRIW